jgi:hypothetical protein
MGRRPRKRNRNGNGGSSKTPAPLTAFRPNLKSWIAVRKFVMCDPATRAIESDGLSQSTYTFSFDISRIPYLADTAQLYQYYRIDQIQVVYKPRITEVNTPHSSALASTFFTPDMVYSFNPYSDVYSNYTALVQRGDAYVVSPLEPFRFIFRPVPLFRLFDNTINDGFANLGKKWITTSRPDVPHYGFVIGIESSASLPPTPTFGGRLFFYYSVSFKNPRLSPSLLSDANKTISWSDGVKLTAPQVEVLPNQALPEEKEE